MLSIGEFARLGRVSPRTIRHYGDVGILAPAHVDPATGYRSYELRQLADLRRILVLRELGELTLHWDPGALEQNVIELQFPVSR
jgi:DNA-binding transcriptional MerR regulator